MNNNTNKNCKIAMRVSSISIVVNIILSLFKFFAGILAHSGAMLSDAVHSASDVASTIVVMIGIKCANKKSDAEHQYGHERLECVSAILLAGFLLATAIGIGFSGVRKVLDGTAGSNLQIPGDLALIAAIVSIVTKEWMYWYTRAAAKRIDSGAMLADAWHHRSDALSSVGAFIGIGGAKMGYPLMDSLATIIISIFIIKASIDIFRDAIDKMIDRSCDEETVIALKSAIEKVNGVEHIDLLKTRLFGDKIYVDIEIAMDGEMSLKASHEIAEYVHHEVESEFENVKHCMVHVNPK